MKRNKITIVGAGYVGATCAHWAATKELGDIVLVDVIEGVAMGKSFDLMESSPVEGFAFHIIGTTNYEHTQDSNVVIICAGLPRKPGMSRDDLLAKNTQIVKSVTEQIAKYSPNSYMIVVSNPVDAMTYVTWKVSGFPTNRIMGMAGILDAARFRTFVAKELDVSVEDVQALVLGGHGDTMVPLARYCTVAGIPISYFLSTERIQAIINNTRKRGGQIVDLLKTGSAFYAPSASAVQMAESIIKDKKRILSCSAYLNGEYGVKGYFIGVPVKIGGSGVEKVIEINLTAEEQEQFNKSVKAVKDLVSRITL
ncbi:MAG TPA: malate dehydrogenase [Syntrophaceae bacterium]|nr:malate dehydrogenase [Syntrophaceae bacterium]